MTALTAIIQPDSLFENIPVFISVLVVSILLVVSSTYHENQNTKQETKRRLKRSEKE